MKVITLEKEACFQVFICFQTKPANAEAMDVKSYFDPTTGDVHAVNYGENIQDRWAQVPSTRKKREEDFSEDDYGVVRNEIITWLEHPCQNSATAGSEL